VCFRPMQVRRGRGGALQEVNRVCSMQGGFGPPPHLLALLSRRRAVSGAVDAPATAVGTSVVSLRDENTSILIRRISSYAAKVHPPCLTPYVPTYVCLAHYCDYSVFV